MHILYSFKNSRLPPENVHEYGKAKYRYGDVE